MDRSLLKGIELLSLDAGNTVIFLDHARLARLANVDLERLIVAEGEAKRLLSTPAAMVDPDWAERDRPGAAGWGRTVATMLARAGVPEASLPGLLSTVWASHVDFNLWSVVPRGFTGAMSALRAKGIKVAIVSNSEGMLDRLFDQLGILSSFDALVDSGKVGFEKPDPRIFEIACAQTGIAAARALHLGDTYATDVVGAMNAGMRAALIDPFGHYEGMYVDVPRVPGVVEVAEALI